MKNMNRITKSEPDTELQTDKFLGILKIFNGDIGRTEDFLLTCDRVHR
jgi:hypothetical protein